MDMAPPEAEQCSVCYFFSNGRCRRHPPQIAKPLDTVITLTEHEFPRVSDTDWCGEFKWTNE